MDDGWFKQLSPGPSQTDWTLGLGEAAHLCVEQSMRHHRFNQPSLHTLTEKQTIQRNNCILHCVVKISKRTPWHAFDFNRNMIISDMVHDQSVHVLCSAAR